MKKIFILITCIFLVTGCYDNIELNELAIITGLGIDYKDDEFYLTYEILSDTKTEDNSAMKSYTISGSGKTIAEAFVKTNYKVGKNPYFAHLKITLLSETIIKDKIKEIVDYLIRDTNIRDEFILLVAKDNSPEEILKHNDKNNPVVSDLIMNIINNEIYNNSLAIGDFFQKNVVKAISDYQDNILNSITIKDDKIGIANSYIFKGYNYQNVLSLQDSVIYNLFDKNVHAMDFSKEYDDKNVTITITNSKKDISITDDKITIDLKLEAKVLENNAKFDLKEEDSYQKLNRDFEKVIENQVKDFIIVLQENESDILGLQEIYYKNTRKSNKGLWTSAKVKINVDLKINTKGFIFEVAK